MNTSSLKAAWRFNEILILLVIILSVALGWTYLSSTGSAGMSKGMPLPQGQPALLGVAALMWAVMVIAMMLPSATPMILTFNRAQGTQGDNGGASLVLFVAGYLIVWSCFSLLAAAVQTWSHAAGVLASLMGATDKTTGGALMMAAGLYQWSPLKDACLTQCRTPLGFLLTEWRPGRAGALVMGLRHGALCVGCCWMLMLLMFAGGIMNLAWMAALTVYMLAEKVLPQGQAALQSSDGCGAGDTRCSNARRRFLTTGSETRQHWSIRRAGSQRISAHISGNTSVVPHGSRSRAGAGWRVGEDCPDAGVDSSE